MSPESLTEAERLEVAYSVLRELAHKTSNRSTENVMCSAAVHIAGWHETATRRARNRRAGVQLDETAE